MARRDGHELGIAQSLDPVRPPPRPLPGTGASGSPASDTARPRKARGTRGRLLTQLLQEPVGKRASPRAGGAPAD